MKRWWWLLPIVICWVLPACDEEQETPPPGPTPTKENTVQMLISNAWDPCYAPTGAKLVFVEAHHLAVYDTVTRQKTIITEEFGSAEYCPKQPVWLAGDTVAFVRKDETSFEHRIWTVPAGGGTVTRFDVDVDKDSSLGGDATGRYVYFTIKTDYFIRRLDLQTGETLNLTNSHLRGYGHADPVAKPGVERIYFIERMIPFNPQPHTEYLNETNASLAGTPKLLLNTDKPFLEGLTISPDGKYAVYPHRDGLWAYEILAGKETWLTRAPDKWAHKDRHPSYSADGTTVVFTRNNNLYTCEAP
ncbi:MAG: PD40 domain-containing protein [Candidatus Coatesbacteria bacterium]|nr:MAG: PD40 domain-containing protein [Candidatus Coatesbacteria bacterium]